MILTEILLTAVRLGSAPIMVLLLFRLTLGWHALNVSTPTMRLRASHVHRAATICLALSIILFFTPENILRIHGLIDRGTSALMIFIGALGALVWGIGNIVALDMTAGKSWRGVYGYAMIPLIASVVVFL